MVQFCHLPTLCTGLWLCGLGQDGDWDASNAILLSIATTEIRTPYNRSGNHCRDFAVIMAGLTATQTKAAEALINMGFTPTQPYGKNDKNKNRHMETGAITIYTMDANKFQDWRDEFKKNYRKTQERQPRFARPRSFVEAPVPTNVPRCTLRSLSNILGVSLTGRTQYLYVSYNATRIHSMYLSPLGQDGTIELFRGMATCRTWGELALYIRRLQDQHGWTRG